MSCSKHFDDEEYRKDLKAKEAVNSDSLQVPSEHRNET